MIKWLKDPVTSFVLAGTMIFAVSSFFPDGGVWAGVCKGVVTSENANEE